MSNKHFPIPISEQLRHEFLGSDRFISLDLNPAFHQLPIDEESRRLFVFTTPHYGSEWQKSGKNLKKIKVLQFRWNFAGLFPATYLIRKQKDFSHKIIFSYWKLALKLSHYTQKSQIDKIYLIEFVMCPYSTGSGFFSGKFGQKLSVISDHICIKEQKYIN